MGADPALLYSGYHYPYASYPYAASPTLRHFPLQLWLQLPLRLRPPPGFSPYRPGCPPYRPGCPPYHPSCPPYHPYRRPYHSHRRCRRPPFTGITADGRHVANSVGALHIVKREAEADADADAYYGYGGYF